MTRQHEVNLQVTTVRFGHTEEPYGLGSRKPPGAVRTRSDARSTGSQPLVPAGGADRTEREGEEKHSFGRCTLKLAGPQGLLCLSLAFFVVNFRMSTP